MEYLADLFAGFGHEFTRSFVAFSPGVALIRMVTALILGGALGLERKLHDPHAPLRLHMLISLAAALFTLIAFELIAEGAKGANPTLRVDPLRLVAAVTSGVGFLAAGSVLNARSGIHGPTTGASMWLAGAVGLTCGTGRLMLAFMCTLLALVVLMIVRRLAILAGVERPSEPDDP